MTFFELELESITQSLQTPGITTYSNHVIQGVNENKRIYLGCMLCGTKLNDIVAGKGKVCNVTYAVSGLALQGSSPLDGIKNMAKSIGINL